jgi:hypothetical protein
VKTLSAPVLAVLAGKVVPLVQLIKLDFVTTGTLALNTSNRNLVWAGVTYLGAAGLGKINAIVDAPGEIKGLQFELSGVAASSVSLALDGADQWQGCPVTIFTAILDPTTYAVLDAETEWTGLGDTMSIQEDGESCLVQATAESSAVDLLRGIPTTYTDPDQQFIQPGDTAFQYVNQQADKPIVWPDKNWFRK